MDWGHTERDFAAGHSDRAPRLNAGQWAAMVSHVRQIASVARHEFGVRAVIHPHAGGYIEFADEIDRIMADIPHAVAGLCLDTGHLVYSGMDPVEWLKRHADRLDYVHFKDIDALVFQQVLGEHIAFFAACGRGVMCPIGKGVIDYARAPDIAGHWLQRLHHRRAGTRSAQRRLQPRRCDGQSYLPAVCGF